MKELSRKKIIEHLELLLNVDGQGFEVLTDKQLDVFYHRFEDYEIRKDKYRTLGEKYGVSRQAIHQIYKRACNTLSKQECFIKVRERILPLK